jgi:hypothetical protein
MTRPMRGKKAAQILNRVLAREPQHPGVTHYHSQLRYRRWPSRRPPRGLREDRARIGHAQHMPSHIFTRLGLWQEAIRSNLDAEASAKAFAVETTCPAFGTSASRDGLSCLCLPARSAGQAGLGVLDERTGFRKLSPRLSRWPMHSLLSPRYALERDDGMRRRN